MLPRHTLLAGLFTLTVVTPALAQPGPYNRSVAPPDITYRPPAGGGALGEISAVIGLQSSSQETLDLSCIITVAANGALLTNGGVTRLYLGIGNVGPWGNDCTLFCITFCTGPFTSTCYPLDGARCLCCTSEAGDPVIMLRGIQVTFPTPSLSPGDIVTVSVAPGGDGLPELDPSDDAGSITIHPPCAPDFTGDGAVNVADHLAFLSLFAAGDARTDLTGDGRTDITDFLAFLSAFSRGC
jgi:hypothetical protein